MKNCYRFCDKVVLPDFNRYNDRETVKDRQWRTEDKREATIALLLDIKLVLLC